ncbi:DUF488 family protein [Stappia indica]|uniref:DUF488 domain-containing protein n=1 Tax=Stappia indica TaxID=538381 RepID=UPI0009F584B5|nr:DUF488 domain-containing protein [Stappia indica]
MLATIGYEKSTLDDFIATLLLGDIEVLIDIRDRAQSRRHGFSKTALSQALADVGIKYIHLKALGDPKAGRDAARAGLMNKFREIFSSVLEQDAAKQALSEVEVLASSKRVCLMCYERDHHCCHRKMVSDYLESSLKEKTIHLGVKHGASGEAARRRMPYNCESATA